MYLKQSGEANGDAGDPYIGLDRFGRVVDQRWLDHGTPQSPKDRFGYGYDRNSNRLYRENLVSGAAAFSELYHSGGASGGYDQLNQLTGFKRGTLNATKDDIQGTPTRTQSWALDEQGNWTTFTTDGTPQNRQHNYQNQATQVGSTNLGFDNNGNTKTDENGRQYVYDAWDRLVEIKDSGGNRIARFTLDALGRRIKEENGTTKDFYYSASWQLLEERHNGASTAKAQYVWSPVYVDALILRDRDADSNGSLEERLYVQQDANWNVTAVVNPAGAVLERYVYDPFGQPTVLKADWTNYPQGQESGLYDWLYLHQGGRYFRFDVSAGTYYFRHRELSVTLGRWLQQDPIGFEGKDTNFYRYVLNNPANSVDPTGQTGILAATGILESFFTYGGWGYLGGSAGNCYRYACDDPKKPDEYHNPWPGPRPWPGEKVTKWPKLFGCKEVIEGALKDGLTKPDKDGCCPKGYRKIAAAVTSKPPPDNDGWNDFHFWRQEADGSWTHKRGNTAVSTVDLDGNPITDPKIPKHRGEYDVFCGYLCVPKGLDLDKPKPKPKK